MDAFCFDGPPPISLHLDVIGGHEVHTADESHQDIDVEVSQSVLAKLLKFDPSLPILFGCDFYTACGNAHPLILLRRRSSSPSSRGDSSAAARTSCNSILIVVNGPL